MPTAVCGRCHSTPFYSSSAHRRVSMRPRRPRLTFSRALGRFGWLPARAIERLRVGIAQLRTQKNEKCGAPSGGLQRCGLPLCSLLLCRDGLHRDHGAGKVVHSVLSRLKIQVDSTV